MTKQETRMLESLFVKHFEPNLDKNTFPVRAQKIIKSAAKSMAFEFKEKEVKRLMGDSRNVFEVDSDNILKYHSVKMLELMSVDPANVFGATRGVEEVTIARQMCIYMLRGHYGTITASNNNLSKTFNRDRTSIIHNLKTAVKLINIKDPIAMSYYSVIKDYKFKKHDTEKKMG